MINKSMRKTIFRDIYSTLNRFLAIFAIAALGAGFYAGLKSTAPNMLATADHYYTDQHLMDIRLLSTFGFTQEDITLLRQRDDIKNVMATYGMDLLVEDPEGTIVMRANALPDDRDDTNADYLNRLVVTEGRLPNATNECVTDSIHGPAIGETVRISNTNDQDSLDMLTVQEFTVVGRVQSPYFISFQRGNTNIGNGKVASFIYVPESAFDSEYYTDVYLTLKGTEGLSSFSDKYKDLVESKVESLEQFGTERAQIRYDEIYSEATAELADARQKLADAQAEADEKLADAWQQIQDGEAELADGRLEIAKNQQLLQDAQAELASGETKLADARALLETNEAKWAAGQTEYATNKALYDAGYAEYLAKSTAYEDAKAQLDGLAAGITGIETATASLGELLPQIGGNATPEEQAAAAGFVQGASASATALHGMSAGMAAGGMAEGAAGLEAAATGVDNALAAGDFATAYGILSAVPGQVRPGLDTAKATLEAALPELIAAQEKLLAAKTQLDAASATLAESRAALDTGWAELANGETELVSARAELADGKQKLADARVKLADAEQELADGKAEYEEKKAEADEKIADAEQKIADGQKELDDLKQPEWFVLDRNANPGYSGFKSDGDRVDSIAVVFPVFFFLVAALVCLTTMTRMVEEQRTQIGTLKALGFDRRSIAFKYLLYAGLASVTGSITGVVICSIVFPTAIWDAYQMMYVMTENRTDPQYIHWMVSILGSVLSTTLATWYACYNELRSVPAELMRPKAPKPGKRIFLERVTFIWRRMKFSHKVTARNLFRYKKRFFMTVVGVAGCTALLLTGFGLQDSIKGVVDIQFGTINLHDITIALTDPSSEKEDTPLNKLLAKQGEAMYVEQMNLEVSHGDLSNDTITTSLYVAEDPERLSNFISFHDRKTGTPIEFPQKDGVIVTEKLASHLELTVGDTFTIKIADKGTGEVTVAGITQNHLLNYVYITPQTYQNIYGELPQYHTVLLDLPKDSTANPGDILSDLIETDGVAGAVEVSDLITQFRDMFDSLDSVIWLILISAGTLAFVVLYNLTNINITERAREIATLKVLGFFKSEVSAYVYRENIILTLIGIVFGFGLGVPLHIFVISKAEVDEVMFGQVIEPLSYLWAALFTIGASLLVNLVMRRRLNKIDMVESLKSAE